MPVPLNELHKYYFQLGSYDKKGVQAIDDVDNGNFNILEWWDGKVRSPEHLEDVEVAIIDIVDDLHALLAVTTEPVVVLVQFVKRYWHRIALAKLNQNSSVGFIAIVYSQANLVRHRS